MLVFTSVARHPRDELLSLRRRSKLLPEMADITDIVSIEPLEPECWKGITAEEVSCVVVL